jgi:hypothetical protein
LSGYLPIPRDFFSQFLWDEKRSFSKAEAYIDLLQFAAYAPSERFVSGKLIELDEGECIASVRFLAERWGWGKDKAAQFLQLLETRRIIRRETRQGETVVILCRYKDWRNQTDARPDSKPDADPDTDQTPTRTNNKKRKKMEKGEHGEKFCPPPSDALAMFSDLLPTEAAKDFDTLFATINLLHPSWAKHPHPTYTEKTTALANSKALFAIVPDTWAKLADYYAAIITAEFQVTYGKFWRPDNRGKFLESITDVLTSCDRYEAALKDGKRHNA